MRPELLPPPETMQAIAELIATSAQHGIGVTFEPSTDGWSVGWVTHGTGGGLAYGGRLEDAARKALPVLQRLIAEEFPDNRRW